LNSDEPDRAIRTSRTNESDRQPRNELSDKIKQWLSDRLPIVIDCVELSINDLGYNTFTIITPKSISTAVFNGPTKVASINVWSIILEVVMDGDKFDERLADTIYEISKIKKAIGKRIETLAAIANLPQDEAIQRLEQLSADKAIDFTIVKMD